MVVRCPECRVLHVEPPARFLCAGCGRRLAWQPPLLLIAEQLPLFQPEGATEQMALPLPGPDPSRTDSRPGAGPPPRAGVSPLPAIGVLAHCVALVTSMRSVVADDAAVVPAILADQDPERLLDLAITAAWLASSLIGEVDQLTDGAGTGWLRQLALEAAQDGQ